MMFANLICFFSPAVQCRQLQIRHNISRHTEFKKTDSDSVRLVKNGSTRHCNLWTNNLPVLLQRRRNLFSLFLSTTGNDISKSFFQFRGVFTVYVAVVPRHTLSDIRVQHCSSAITHAYTERSVMTLSSGHIDARLHGRHLLI